MENGQSEDFSTRRSGTSKYTDKLSCVNGISSDMIDDECTFDVPCIPVTNPRLYRDMQYLVLIYGEKSVQYQLYEHIDEIVVELHIPSDIQNLTTEVKTIHKSEPIIVKLYLSLSRYLDSPDRPKVEVYKRSQKGGFRIDCYQVHKFLEKYLSEEWHHLHQDYQKCLQTKNNTIISKCVTTDIISEYPSDEAVEELVNLGFEADIARNALIITHGSIAEAASLIFDNPLKCAKASNLSKTIGDLKSDEKPPSADSTDSTVPSTQTVFSQVIEDENNCKVGESDLHGDIYKMQNDEETKDNTEERFKIVIKGESNHPETLNKLKLLLPINSVIEVHDVKRMQDVLNLKPSSMFDGKYVKVVPSIADGFLVQIYRYVRQRIPTLNEYCAVCDEPIGQESCTIYKSSVCCNDLCALFAFGCLGDMADVAEEIANRPEVVDLLINLTRAASKSGRRELIFYPFPIVIHPENPHTLLLTPLKPDYDLAETLIDEIPPMKEMSLMESVKTNLDASHPLTYPLVQWIITNNRFHIEKLPLEKQLDFMHTNHQFQLGYSSLAKEAAFRKAKRKHGSSFAFHGSGIENWHSIIRQGLIKASGTRLQVNGAASGEGIYLSPELAVSMRYSRTDDRRYNVKTHKREDDGKHQFLDSSKIRCIALCEVINTSLKKYESTWLCTEPDNVCIRFLFVYENDQIGDLRVKTDKEVYLLPIYKACGYLDFGAVDKHLNH